MASFPSDALDDLFAAASGPVSHRDIRAAVAEDIRSELHDPIVDAFSNLRRMSADEMLRFDPLRSLAPGDGYRISVSDRFGYLSGEDSSDEARFERVRASPKFSYTIGEYETSSFYHEFLSDEAVRSSNGRMVTVREMTDELSRNPKSCFRSWFRMPLYMVCEIVDRFIAEGWIRLSQHCRTPDRLKMKAELLVLGTLAMLGGTLHSFRQLKPLTHICASDHSNFYLSFVRHLASISHEYVFMPRTPEELQQIMRRYEEVGLPGAAGSLDVVHVKRANCPAGDYNRSKGKESYPSLAFECITDFDRRILGVFGPQFGCNNDKHIVKIDHNVHMLSNGWLSSVEWNYYGHDEQICSSKGVYVICDNGYISWPTTICPFMGSRMNGRLEDYFSSNIESVRKDVECVFGILKGRWASLDQGFKYREVKTCGDIFLTCAVLHNMMLVEMLREDKPSPLQRGLCSASDGMWLEGPSDEQTDSDKTDAAELKEAFEKRRMQLCHHLRVWKDKNRV